MKILEKIIKPNGKPDQSPISMYDQDVYRIGQCDGGIYIIASDIETDDDTRLEFGSHRTFMTVSNEVEELIRLNRKSASEIISKIEVDHFYITIDDEGGGTYYIITNKHNPDMKVAFDSDDWDKIKMTVKELI